MGLEQEIFTKKMRPAKKQIALSLIQSKLTNQLNMPNQALNELNVI